jgi:transposase
LGLDKTVVEAVEVDPDGAVVVSVRPRYSQRDRCPHYRRRCPGYDQGDGRRRWRALDRQTTVCYVEADAPRVECKEHERLSSRRSRGLATTPGSPAALRTRSRG